MSNDFYNSNPVPDKDSDSNTPNLTSRLGMTEAPNDSLVPKNRGDMSQVPKKAVDSEMNNLIPPSVTGISKPEISQSSAPQNLKVETVVPSGQEPHLVIKEEDVIPNANVEPSRVQASPTEVLPAVDPAVIVPIKKVEESIVKSAGIENGDRDANTYMKLLDQSNDVEKTAALEGELRKVA